MVFVTVLQTVKSYWLLAFSFWQKKRMHLNIDSKALYKIFRGDDVLFGSAT